MKGLMMEVIKMKETTIEDVYEYMKSIGCEIDADMWMRWCQIYAKCKDGLINFLVCESATSNKPMLRYAPMASFDRWANSGCEIFFDSWCELLKYLKDNAIQIYIDCLQGLSQDYFDLTDSYVELKERR